MARLYKVSCHRFGLRFNTMIQSFPNNVIAGMFSFKEEEFFELTEEAQREPVKVQF